MMRGRHPSGPEYVEQLEASALAKERLRIVLQTIVGEYRVQEACQLLGIGEQRFDQLRRQALQAAVEGLESKPSGRPRQEESVGPDEVVALRQRIAELEGELQASRVREEIALVLPRVAPNPSDTEKKTVSRPRHSPQS
jgi:transposase-like protein